MYKPNQDTWPNTTSLNTAERNRVRWLRLMGLPQFLLHRPELCKRIGLKLVQELKELEAHLTEVEKTIPVEILKLCPWYEEREQYKRDKAAGNVKEVQWWEALSFLENTYPHELQLPEIWGGPMRGMKKSNPHFR
jgi:hypothetical protein